MATYLAEKFFPDVRPEDARSLADDVTERLRTAGAGRLRSTLLVADDDTILLLIESDDSEPARVHEALTGDGPRVDRVTPCTIVEAKMSDSS